MITAKKFRTMTTKEIINSIEVGLRVLADRSMTGEDLNGLFSIMAEAASEVKQRVVDKKLISSFSLG